VGFFHFEMEGESVDVRRVAGVSLVKCFLLPSLASGAKFQGAKVSAP
jgi:hypothetical protein